MQVSDEHFSYEGFCMCMRHMFDLNNNVFMLSGKKNTRTKNETCYFFNENIKTLTGPICCRMDTLNISNEIMKSISESNTNSARSFLWDNIRERFFVTFYH